MIGSGYFEDMFQVYRDLPAKPKASNEVCEHTNSAESQTILSWSSDEGRFYKDANGTYSICYRYIDKIKCIVLVIDFYSVYKFYKSKTSN